MPLASCVFVVGWGHSTAVCVVVQRMPRSMYALVHCEQPRTIVERVEDVGHLSRDAFTQCLHPHTRDGCTQHESNYRYTDMVAPLA